MDHPRVTLGAQYLGAGRTRFRVWAPRRRTVEVQLESGPEAQLTSMTAQSDGYFEQTVAASPGMRYRYRLDGGDCFPDPCSRSQPEGPHQASEIVDSTSFRWTDAGWKGLPLRGQVFYELHVGAFTPGGTFAAAAERLRYLQDVGITVIELMPVAVFPGRFNWGYDGVSLFAPCAVYGTPDDLRSLVDQAHHLGIGVILDVVYNHLGPSGNYLSQYSNTYFTDRYPADWGEPLRFEGEGARPVREFFTQNAAHWIADFHFDGLRLDATQNIYDESTPHILTEVIAAARAAAPDRQLIIVAENESQDVKFVTSPARGGYGADALWVDDFHHSARVAMTGRAEAYCSDYRGNAQELLSCALRNSLYQGQWYEWQKQPRGTNLTDIPSEQAVFFIQNHDQISNFLTGQRSHQFAGMPRARALAVFSLLLPQSPLLFMGQELFADAPFLYFVDHEPDLQQKVIEGRNKFLCQFPSAKHALELEGYRVPSGEEAFRLSTLQWAELEPHARSLRLTRELLRLRREDAVFGATERPRLDGAVLSDSALVLRFRGSEQAGDRLVLFNWGGPVSLRQCSEPLVAPLRGRPWTVLLSSEDCQYGGSGTPVNRDDPLHALAAQCALVLISAEKT